MNINNLKLQYIEGIYKTKALLIKEKAFVLQSGKKSHIYLNHRNFLSNHTYLALIANIYQELSKFITDDYVLGVVDSIMSPIIVGAMSVKFKRNYVVTQKTPLSHGTQESIYGEVKNNVLLIDDMTSTGNTLIDAAEKIRAKGGYVQYAIISAYRDDEAIKNLKRANIELLSIVSFSEIINKLDHLLTALEKDIVQSNPLIMD